MGIENGKVVRVHYTLTSDDGELLDTSSGGEPLEYLHGAENIVPGLENALAGKTVGDRFDVLVTPEEGYGHRIEQEESVPRSMFPAGAELREGMPLKAETPEGRTIVLWVEEILDDIVIVTQNHPLAGHNLNFTVEVVSVRDASDEEKTHGHVHGPGHAH